MRLSAEVPPPHRHCHGAERSIGFGCWGGCAGQSPPSLRCTAGTPCLPTARAEPALPTLPGYVPARGIEPYLL